MDEKISVVLGKKMVLCHHHHLICVQGEICWRKEWLFTPALLPKNPMDRAAWRATVHEVAKSGT